MPGARCSACLRGCSFARRGGARSIIAGVLFLLHPQPIQET